MTNLFVRSGISFVDRSEVLTHIGNEMLAKGVVHDTWPQALIAREAEFPTGIMLEQHAIAIPHCEAIHAKSSAIYLLRPTNKVHFQQADDDNDVAVSLVIALIVENLKASPRRCVTSLVMPCRAKCCSFPETAGQRDAGPVLCKTDHSPMVPLRLH